MLGRGDLIVAIDVPASAEGRASHYLKVRDRAVLRVRACVRRGRGGDRRPAHPFGAARDGRRRAQALASEQRPKRRCAGSSLDDVTRSGRRSPHPSVDARPLAHNAFKIELAQRVALRALANRGRTRMNAIGQPMSRADGRLKVTGGARYTADVPLGGAAHAAIVHSTIANGRSDIDRYSAAEKAPGVLAVFTHRNMPRMNPTPRPWSHLHPHGQGYLPLQDDQIHYAGPADRPGGRRDARPGDSCRTLIKVEYEASRPTYSTARRRREAVDPPQFLWPVASSVGDAEKGIADAP